MVEELKRLIEKIQEEGIRAAETKAQEIEEEAKRQAKAIIERAQSQAQELLTQAQEEVRRLQIGSKATIQQAGRDLILSLKKEINAMLDKLITVHVREALNSEELARIITILIKDYVSKDRKEEIIISLKKEDAEKVKELLGELKQEVKKGIILNSSEDIHGGFVISYDSGKSHFDFTDKALTEYLSSYLKPQLKQILQG